MRPLALTLTVFAALGGGANAQTQTPFQQYQKMETEQITLVCARAAPTWVIVYHQMMGIMQQEHVSAEQLKSPFFGSGFSNMDPLMFSELAMAIKNHDSDATVQAIADQVCLSENFSQP